MSTSPAFFPMMVNLEAKKCVVVGGGRVASEKIAGLLACKARIVVVSPRAEAIIRRQNRDGTLIWRRRTFSRKDVEGAFLVIAATNSSDVNGSVFRACRARGILCNAVDDPEHCDFFYPAIVRRGPLQIAISTTGYSPALASRLRQELEKQFGPEWAAWVEHIGEVRRELLTERLSPEARRKRLLQLASPQAMRAFVGRRESKRPRRMPKKGTARTPTDR